MCSTYRHRECVDDESIRILTLLSGALGSPIECRLRSISLKAKEHYDAVSYAWGDPADTKAIFVHDEVLRIPANLEECLQHLRKPDQILSLWVDAVCINQNDLTEKALQVSIMGDIFRRCTSVYVWLGVPDSGVDADPFEIIRHFAQDRHLSELPCFRKDESSQEVTFVESAAFSIIWSAFRDGFQKPFWQRYWTIQEVLLSSSPIAVLGHWRIPWASIKQCEINYRRHVYDCCAFSSGLFTEQHTYFADALVVNTQLHPNSKTCIRPKSSSDLHYFLRSFRYKTCQDPRDKVFGILGLVDKSAYPGIIIDYTLSTCSVYTNAMLAILQNDKGDLHCLTGHGFNSPNHGLPSWVRDLAQCPDISSGVLEQEMVRYHTYKLYDASKSSKAVPVVTDGSIMSLHGVCVDRIKHVGRPIVRRNWRHIRETLLSWLRLAEIEHVDNKVEVHFDKPQDNAFWRTIMGDALVESDQMCSRMRDIDIDCVRSWLNKMLVVTASNVEPPLNSCLRALIASIVGRALICTEQGRIGLSCAECQPGDEVWVLCGGRVPFIVRPLQVAEHCASLSKYIFVGECYVHGIMDGEALVENCVHRRIALQ